MPKIVFIEPRPSNLHIFSQYPLPRLGPILLGTIMRGRGWDVELFVEEVRSIDAAVLRDADIIAISTITATAPRAYAIADQARSLGKTVLMGGPHVTFLTDEALEHADFVLRGEAEETLPLFLEAWRAGGDLSAVPGLSRRVAGAAVHNPPASLVDDLDALPYPDFSSAAVRPRQGGRPKHHPGPDLPRLPLPLLFLFGDRHVRQGVSVSLAWTISSENCGVTTAATTSFFSTTTTSPPTGNAGPRRSAKR